MKSILNILVFIITVNGYSQIVPSTYEHISHLMTFGPSANAKWGDDDKVQVYFYSMPTDQKGNIYFRIFDPEISGDLDQKNGSFDTKTEFAIYGGRGAYSTKAARGTQPTKGYDAGIILDKKTFGSSSTYENKWYTFGPFNPKEGELIHAEKEGEADRYIFKIIIKGKSGNDGNGYKLSMSSSPSKNTSIPSGKAFAFEICFRLFDDITKVAHFYPFVGEGVTNIKQCNFDFDNNGQILITSVVKNMNPAATSSDGNWKSSIHKIEKDEHNLVLDLQIVQRKKSKNDMAIYILNQYGEAMPFFSIPADGLRKYKYKIKVKINI